MFARGADGGGGILFQSGVVVAIFSLIGQSYANFCVQLRGLFPRRSDGGRIIGIFGRISVSAQKNVFHGRNDVYMTPARLCDRRAFVSVRPSVRPSVHPYVWSSVLTVTCTPRYVRVILRAIVQSFMIDPIRAFTMSQIAVQLHNA